MKYWEKLYDKALHGDRESEKAVREHLADIIEGEDEDQLEPFMREYLVKYLRKEITKRRPTSDPSRNNELYLKIREIMKKNNCSRTKAISILRAKKNKFHFGEGMMHKIFNEWEEFYNNN